MMRPLAAFHHLHLLLLPALLLFPVAAFSQGTGLTGQYYDTDRFGTLKTTRVDASIDFSWGAAIPSGTALTSGDTFSVAWSGQVEPEFPERYTFHVTADDGARLWIDDRLVALRTFAQGGSELRGQVELTAGKRVNLRLEYVEQTGNASVKLEWSSSSRWREVIPAARLYPDRVNKAGGALLREHWSGIPGAALSALTSSSDFPERPGGREFLTSFECLAQNWADSYGTRVTGFLVPPVSGDYSFAVSGDDAVELYLSTDVNPANKSLVASISSPTGFRAWGEPSAARSLVQGQRYYVELLHKEDTGDDHWSAGWKLPGDADFQVIPGSALLQPGLDTGQPLQADLLNTMARDHPRLFATAERFARLRAAYLSGFDSQPKTWASSMVTSANSILGQAPVSYSQDVRGTILSQARTVKDRMYRLALAWWLTGDAQYAERAWTELSTVAAFADWHPAHFLDTAEMTHAFAIAYDWLYSYWTEERRDTIRTAILSKGLNAGLSQFTSNAGWTKPDSNNWNMVCTGGLTMGALALGAESEATAEDIIHRSLNSTRPVWKRFTTDNGAWYEGPGYWGYTTEYGIRMLAALECVLGSDFGIGSTQALSETGLAPIHAYGSAGVLFNFADASASTSAQRGPIFQWLARRYGQPLYDGWANQGSGGPLDALWWNASDASLTGSGLPPDMAFHGEASTAFDPQEMVTLRGNWSDSRATYAGCKGGDMGAAHGNLDAGTFVLDALGKRWFHDLGGDDYALPGYFSSSPSSGTDRWDYYRMRPEGQNTLAINPSGSAGMVLGAVAPLIAFETEPGGTGAFAVHDLTGVYSGMTRLWRGVRLMGARDQVLVQDEIQAASGSTVWWFAHYTHPATTVTLEPDGRAALMQQGNERLLVKIVSGEGAFQILDAVPLASSPDPAGQNANAGYKKLAIQLSNVTDTTLAVWFVPLAAGDGPPAELPDIAPLNTWNLAATNDAPMAPAGDATNVATGPVDIDLRAYVMDDATPAGQMRFILGAAMNGTVVLLDDGHTARFTPAPNYTGVPSFAFTATDSGPDADTVLAYDFDLPHAADSQVVLDVSGNGRDGAIDFAGAGSFSLVPDQPATLGTQGARSIDLVESGVDAARIQRTVAAGELDWNADDWTIAGWFKRRDIANDDMVWHLSNGDGFGSNDELYLNCPAGANTVRLQHYHSTAAAYDVDIAQTGVAPGSWRHFAVVRRGSKIELYVDGALAGADGSFALALNQTYPLVFGGHASATFQPGRWFDGQLDDLLVCKRALEQEEVSALATGLSVRHFGGLTSTGTITVSAAVADHFWTNGTSGTPLTWTTGSNWLDDTPPAAARWASVRFFSGQTLAGGAIESQNDAGAGFLLNNLTLGGTSSAATTVTIGGGSFAFLNNGAQFPTVNLAGTSGSGTNSLTYVVNNPLALAADTTFNGTNNGTFIFSGDISGAGGLTRLGTSSKLILAGNNSYTGVTTIQSGTLQIGNDGASGSPGTGEVVNHGQLRFDRTGIVEVPNAVSGTGSVYVDCPIDESKAALGTVVLSGANTFTGDVTVQSGALRITHGNALGEGTKTVILSNGTTGAPQLRLNGAAIELPAAVSYRTSSSTGAIVNEAGDNAVQGEITLSGGGGDTKILVSAGLLTLNGPIAPNTTNRKLQLDGAGAGRITNTIRNGGGANVLLEVRKLGSGSWTLAGANTYGGATTVNAGTLVLGHPAALGHGGLQMGNTTGGTSVSSGATLDLNGQEHINEVLTLRGSGSGGAGCLVNQSSAPAGLAGGVLSSISISAGGVHASVPEVMLSGGSGSGAAAVATLGLSAASFTIDGGSKVYSSAPTVILSGGGGAGAAASAVLTSGVVTGLTITNPGAGYSSAPSISFSGGTVATAGDNPSGTGNAENFVVSGVTVTHPGSGYSEAPAVSFSSGSGTVATANLSAVVLAADSTLGGSGDIWIDSPIRGSYKLTKAGSGTLALSGANTYTGTTTVNAGRLVLSGVLTSSISNTAIFAPQGAPATSGSFTQTAAGTLQLRLEPGGGDGLSAASLTLNGTLDLVAAPDLPPDAAFVILNNTGASPVSGTFSGKPENSTFSAAGYTWRISYAGGTGNDVTLAVEASPIEQWRFTHFGSSQNGGSGLDSADGDGDGVPNLLEYATGRNPALRDAAQYSVTLEEGTMEFLYTRSKAATDVIVTVEWSDTLGETSWTSDGVTSSVIGEDGATQQVRALVPGNSERRFARLRVTR